jgi:hypothetical protein
VEIGRSEEAVFTVTPEGALQIQRTRTLALEESEKKVAWTRGKLILTGERLPEVVREINRYHREKAVIADTALEQVRIGGTIDPATNDYRVIVHALSNTCPIDIDDTDPSVIRLTSARALGQCPRTELRNASSHPPRTNGPAPSSYIPARLQSKQVRIPPVPTHQLLVTPILNHPPTIEYSDPISHPYR